MIFMLDWPDHMRNNNTVKELREGEFIFSININGKIFAMAGHISRIVPNDLIHEDFDKLAKNLINTRREQNATNAGID